MTSTRSTHRRSCDHAPLVIGTIPFSLLNQPLEYIFADHARQRAVCAVLQRFASDRRATRADADMVAAFLALDRVLHEADEDEDLFPAVSRRAIPEDRLDAVLAPLRNDHRRNRLLIDHITSALGRHPAREIENLTPGDRDRMQAFASAEGRHIAIGNCVVLAIARVRLSLKDLATISRRMKDRRGVRE